MTEPDPDENEELEAAELEPREVLDLLRRGEVVATGAAFVALDAAGLLTLATA